MITPNEYQQGALRTEASLEAVLKLVEQDRIRLLHAALGLASEAGEFADQIKRHLFYQTPLDRVNLAEELGDLMWYIAVAAAGCGTTLEAILQANLQKLRTRYPDKFTVERAVVRDLVGERRVLEGIQGSYCGTCGMGLEHCTCTPKED